MRLDGVVVLYNPDVEVYHNISKYIDCLDKLYVIDNSKEIKCEIVNKIKSLDVNKIAYIAKGTNIGLASALNIGINMAYNTGASWVLMMNQDSYIDKINLGMMKEYLENNQINNLAWVSARFEMPNEKFRPKKSITYSCMEIISGSIINSNIFKKAGPFIDKFYMDVIDHEYTMRLNKQGYIVLRLNYVEFKHKLGNCKIKEGIITCNYPPMRYYLIVRNNLYLNRMYKYDYPEICGDLVKSLYKNWLVRIFYEDNTWEKIRAMIAGYIAYKRGV